MDENIIHMLMINTATIHIVTLVWVVCMLHKELRSLVNKADIKKENSKTVGF